MAGHSQFKNIMHRKGAQDAKKAKLFTKIMREITTAVKVGLPDPNSNPRLRAAIQKARQESMPREKIENAIKRGTGEVGGENFESIRYEGYGPGGVAIIVETLTDNRNRTAAEVRSTFTKLGGNMGETGSVGFMFDHAGLITYPKAKASDDAMFEAALDAGADNCESSDTHHTVTCSLTSFGQVRDDLEKKFGEAEGTKTAWIYKTSSPVNDQETANALFKLIETLEDNDDVQEVFSNAEIPEEILAKVA